MGADEHIYQNMEAMLHWINENGNLPLTAAMISGRMHMSPATFSRYFQRFTGTKFPDYINTLRLKSAKQDLAFTDKSVTELALDNGFSSSSVFSRAFQSYEGCSPSEYRKRCREAQEAAGSTPGEETVIEIVPDPDSPDQIWSKSWLEGINIGDVREMLLPAFRTQLMYAKERIGFSYIRLWGIFIEEILPVSQMSGTDYHILDEIFDFLISNGFIPWIELGKMPVRRRTDLANLDDLLSSEMVSTSAQEEMDRYTRLFMHWMGRYGAEVLASWRFDLYSPDLIPDLVSEEAVMSYVQLYLQLRRWLRLYLPGVRLGYLCKPVLSRTDMVEKILDVWPSGEQPDYFSLYCFPYIFEGSNRLSNILGDTTFTLRCLKRMREEMRQHHLDRVPVYITEWNTTIRLRNAFNDSCAKAALMLANVEETIGCDVPVMLYELSDLDSVSAGSTEPMFGGNGILSVNGFEKPVFMVLALMRQMPGRIAAHGKGYIAACDGLGRYDLLLWHMPGLPDSYFTQREYEITTDYILDELPAGQKGLRFEARIRVPSDVSYSVRTQSLHTSSSDMLGMIREFGMEEVFDREDIQYLQRVIQPKRKVRRTRPVNGMLVLEAVMQPYDICYISARPQLPC